jgi:hypothetical protein
MKPWKIQKFAGDVIHDLRSRNLLLLVVMFLVAIVAVPVLVSKSSSSDAASSAGLGAQASATNTPETQSAVVAYHPGIRNFRQRLKDLSAKDPFHQKLTQPAAAPSQLDSTATAPTTTGSSESSGTSVSSGSSTGSTSTGTVTHHSYVFHSVADLSFGDVSQPLVRHPKTKTYALLPNETAPVLVYLGSTLDEKRALFSVSTYTEQLTGPGTCAPGPTDCSLLALAPGQSEDMVYSGDGRTYRLTINKINRVIIKNPSGN